MPTQHPGFIIGGAPRAATTWLYHVLDRHPRIHLAKPVRPEPKFFLVDELFDQGIDFYRAKYFSDIGDLLTGEKSTNYLESATAAERIYQTLPDVKLIFCLREPADRAFSNWRWSVKNGLEALSFDEAIRREPQREQLYAGSLKYSRPYSYFSRGLYARHLRAYIDRFPREHILCVRYEDIVCSPADVATTVHAFLGLDPRPEDGLAVAAVNTTPPKPADQDTLSALRHRYAEANRELQELLGSSFDVWMT